MAGDMKMAPTVFSRPDQTMELKPTFANPAPTSPPISACDELEECRKSGDDVPDDGANQRREDHLRRHDGRIDDAGAERFGHMQAEEQEGDEVEEGRPCDRILRAQHTGGDDGGDGIGGIVQTVQKIEEQRDGDKAD